MISPTIGRVVLVRLTPDQVDPFPALVTKVWGDRCINAAGFNDGGTAFAVSSCPLIQDDEPRPELGWFAEWMPYQKAQAAKHDAGTTESSGPVSA